jgi:hypothetical protein
MAAVAYTRRVFLQRIRKHISNTRLSSDDFEITDNEICLNIDQVQAERIVGMAYQGAKIDGALVVNEAYLITYKLPALSQDYNTGYWYTSLPQPPMGLPLGYSINRGYFADPSTGVSQEITWIKAKRVGRRMTMPLQSGVRGWVENNTIYLQASNNFPLIGLQVYISMPSARTTDLDAIMNMPEDDLDFVFKEVIGMLAQRYGFPIDQIKDDLPAGNKSS